MCQEIRVILTEERIEEIIDEAELVRLSDVDSLSNFEFDCGVDEYNNFLKEARAFDELNISKVHLLIHKKTQQLIGYMALSSDVIKLSVKERKGDGFEQIPFASISALKIGKLAVSQKKEYKSKGYGAFLIEMAHAMAYDLNKNGVACRFLTVDADIEYNPDTPEYYKRLGFTRNCSGDYQGRTECVSMRRDIFSEAEILAKMKVV